MREDEAKDILRDTKCWPQCTSKWGATEGVRWIRAQPVSKEPARASSPVLNSPGAKLFSTQPDGMWIRLRGAEYVDVIVFEHCSSIQNLNDKRSRYMATSSSVLVKVQGKWLREKTRRQKGGRRPRWEACGAFGSEDFPDELNVPVRFLRAVYVIPDSEYRRWKANNVPEGHEYFMRHSSLKSRNGQKMQEFMGRLSLNSHFYTR